MKGINDVDKHRRKQSEKRKGREMRSHCMIVVKLTIQAALLPCDRKEPVERRRKKSFYFAMSYREDYGLLYSLVGTGQTYDDFLDYLIHGATQPSLKTGSPSRITVSASPKTLVSSLNSWFYFLVPTPPQYSVSRESGVPPLRPQGASVLRKRKSSLVSLPSPCT